MYVMFAVAMIAAVKSCGRGVAAGAILAVAGRAVFLLVIRKPGTDR